MKCYYSHTSHLCALFVLSVQTLEATVELTTTNTTSPRQEERLLARTHRLATPHMSVIPYSNPALSPRPWRRYWNKTLYVSSVAIHLTCMSILNSNWMLMNFNSWRKRVETSLSWTSQSLIQRKLVCIMHILIFQAISCKCARLFVT